MPVLRERRIWKRELKPRPTSRPNDLTADEQANVMAALRVLYARHGTWREVGKLLGLARGVMSRLSRGDDKPTAGVAIRAAKHVGASVEDILAGNFAQIRKCPMCGGCGTVVARE